MTVRPSGPTVIGMVIRSQMSTRLDIVLAEGQGETGKDSKVLKAEGKIAAGKKQKVEARWYSNLYGNTNKEGRSRTLR